jgi:hypothetical protein
MLEMLGDINMQNHGNKYLASIMFFLMLCSSTFAQNENIYFTCSYQNNAWDTYLKVSKFDLSRGALIDSVILPIGGEIATNTPICINNNRSLLFVAANDGEAAKNSNFKQRVECNYAIIDSNLNVINESQLPGFTFLGIDNNMEEQSPMIRYSLERNHSFITMRGRLNITRSNQLRISDSVEYHEIDNEFPIIGNFQFFKNFTGSANQLFWAIVSNGNYVLKLDVPARTLIDSLNVGNNLNYSHLLFYNEQDSIIYSFTINSNTLGGPEEQRKNSIDPSYLIKYNANSFQKVDSIIITYPSLDIGYTGSEIGILDKVNSYLVYYFFAGEDYRYFSPAMLFIFDTRTNEATWLRVGWR